MAVMVATGAISAGGVSAILHPPLGGRTFTWCEERDDGLRGSGRTRRLVATERYRARLVPGPKRHDVDALLRRSGLDVANPPSGVTDTLWGSPALGVPRMRRRQSCFGACCGRFSCLSGRSCYSSPSSTASGNRTSIKPPHPRPRRSAPAGKAAATYLAWARGMSTVSNTTARSSASTACCRRDLRYLSGQTVTGPSR